MSARVLRARPLSHLGLGVAVLLLIGGLLEWPAPADAPPVSADPDTVNVARVYGRIQFVEHFPDYKVQVVDHFPDLRVQRVEHFPDGPGKWQVVDQFPDYKIQLVEHFPDFTIQYVEHFPGVE
jgi:hypothetical protein